MISKSETIALLYRYNVVPLIKATIQDMVTVFQGKWIIINFKAYCSYSKYNTLLHDFSVKNMFLEKTYCNFKAIHGYKGYRYELKNFLWEFIVRILGFFTRCFRVFRKSDENSFRNEYVPKGKPKPRTRIARKNETKHKRQSPAYTNGVKRLPQHAW